MGLRGGLGSVGRVVNGYHLPTRWAVARRSVGVQWTTDVRAGSAYRVRVVTEVVNGSPA